MRLVTLSVEINIPAWFELIHRFKAHGCKVFPSVLTSSLPPLMSYNQGGPKGFLSLTMPRLYVEKQGVKGLFDWKAVGSAPLLDLGTAVPVIAMDPEVYPLNYTMSEWTVEKTKLLYGKAVNVMAFREATSNLAAILAGPSTELNTLVEKAGGRIAKVDIVKGSDWNFNKVHTSHTVDYWDKRATRLVIQVAVPDNVSVHWKGFGKMGARQATHTSEVSSETREGVLVDLQSISPVLMKMSQSYQIASQGSADLNSLLSTVRASLGGMVDV